MHRLTLLPVLLLPLLLFSVGCIKDTDKPIFITDPPMTSYIAGRLVINAACSHYVVKVLSPVDTSKITARWKDPQTDVVYDSVFTVANTCSFDSSHVLVGDTILFLLDANPPLQSCAVCQIYYPTPPKSNALKNLHKYR